MRLKSENQKVSVSLSCCFFGWVFGIVTMDRVSSQFMNDPLRVAREGPFWAGMFVVLGAVVGFGGTIEVSQLTDVLCDSFSCVRACFITQKDRIRPDQIGRFKSLVRL